MEKLTPITLDNGAIIYFEATETEEAAFDSTSHDPNVNHGEQPLVPKGGLEKTVKSFQSLQDTIESYTTYTLNAFKELSAANIENVTLEFGVKVGGEAGIPYITKGTAESNLKITVQCSFPTENKKK